MRKPDVRVYPSSPSLTEAAAETVLEAAEDAIAKRGVFTLAISGGHTPERLFQLLADGEFQRQIDWSKTHLFWVDERPVPVSDNESNFKLANDNLLSQLGTKPLGLHRVPTELMEPAAVAKAYEEDLRRTFAELGEKDQWPSFDLILLGMGDDGHTASLMPDGESHGSAAAWVDAPWVPHLKTFRFTLTESVINHARQAVFLVEGKGKAETLRAVLEGPREPKRYPSQRIDLVNGQLTWLVDQEAAAKLAAFRASA